MKPPAHPSHASAATQSAVIKTVALFEAFKGTVVLVAASGFLSLIHKDVHLVAARFIHHMHLNPASRYPLIFIDAASNLNDKRLVVLAVGAGMYAFVRFFEAYGLYTEKVWAEALAAISGAIYVPFELASLFRRPTWHSAIFLLINLLIVTLMVLAILRRRENATHTAA